MDSLRNAPHWGLSTGFRWWQVTYLAGMVAGSALVSEGPHHSAHAQSLCSRGHSVHMLTMPAMGWLVIEADQHVYLVVQSSGSQLRTSLPLWDV